jgi:hypothetical protein
MKNLLLFPALFVSIWVARGYAQDRTMAEVPGAKMYFSNKPMPASAEGSKTSFNSSEYVYARLDLGGKTLKDAFNLVPQKSGYYYLRVWVLVSKDGEEFGSHHQWESMWVRDADINKTALDFDLLPEAAKAKTVVAGTELFNGGMMPGALSLLINEDYFPEDGKYFVRVKVFMKTWDAYGRLTDYDKWPSVTGDFTYQFKTADVPAILSNRDAAKTAIEKIMN